MLEKSSGELLVMHVGDVGWSDWGEPQRVLGTLTNAKGAIKVYCKVATEAKLQASA